MRKPAALALAGIAMIGALAATPAPAAAAVGRLVLTTDTGSSSQLIYGGCENPVLTHAPSGLATFNNTPAPGCAVWLSNGSQHFVLCAGQGTVPAVYANNALIHIRQGTSLPCL
ncbi:hypothetical protein ACIBHY_36565 [Nonomuraea sp. NPDC050547]|uniref:hypothetical protein n=1 Tax=Nonomuraea sp. NPDC050547 TaxID=3364368 RepID=UPI0037B55441